MSDHIDAIIKVKVPKWQIGEEAQVFFPDTMCTKGVCEEVRDNFDIGYAQGYKDGKEERPTGKWIDHWSEDLHKLGYRQCSNCKAGCQIYDHGTRKSDLPWIDGQQFTLERICKYCPNCGAKMERVGEG